PRAAGLQPNVDEREIPPRASARGRQEGKSAMSDTIVTVFHKKADGVHEVRLPEIEARNAANRLPWEYWLTGVFADPPEGSSPAPDPLAGSRTCAAHRLTSTTQRATGKTHPNPSAQVSRRWSTSPPRHERRRDRP